MLNSFGTTININDFILINDIIMGESNFNLINIDSLMPFLYFLQN